MKNENHTKDTKIWLKKHLKYRQLLLRMNYVLSFK